MRSTSLVLALLLLIGSSAAWSAGSTWTTATLQEIAEAVRYITPAPMNARGRRVGEQLQQLDIHLQPELDQPYTKETLIELYGDDWEREGRFELKPNEIGPGRLIRVEGLPGEADLLLMDLWGWSLLDKNYLIIFQELGAERWVHMATYDFPLERSSDPPPQYSMFVAADQVWLRQSFDFGGEGYFQILPVIATRTYPLSKYVFGECDTTSSDGEAMLTLYIDGIYTDVRSGYVYLGQDITLELHRNYPGAERVFAKLKVPFMRWHTEKKAMLKISHEGHQLWAMEDVTLCEDDLETVFPHLEGLFLPSNDDMQGAVERMGELIRKTGLLSQ